MHGHGLLILNFVNCYKNCRIIKETINPTLFNSRFIKTEPSFNITNSRVIKYEREICLIINIDVKHKNNPRDNTFFRKMSKESTASIISPDVGEVPLEDLMDSFGKMLEEDGKPHEVILGNEKNVCGEDNEGIETSLVQCISGGIKDVDVNPLGVANSCLASGLAIGEDFQPQTNQGVFSTESRDARGCVTGEVVENLCVNYSDFLNKSVVCKVKRTWQAPPRVAKPLTPSAAPRSGLVATQEGGMAVTKLVPKENLFAPNFYGDRRSGFAINMEGFKCSASYTCTFDIARECRVCPNEHEAFPANLLGALVVGDSYTPSIIGGDGACVPVFRQHNAGFKEIADSLRFLLRFRKKADSTPSGRPNLIIISLPGHLQAVGPDQYLKEFNIFKGWIQHFLQTGVDYNPSDPRIFSPCTTTVQVCEGFALFSQADSGISESYAVLARSFKILTAVDPSQEPGFFYEALENTLENLGLDPPHKELTRYIAIAPVKPEFEVYEYTKRYVGLSDAAFVGRNVDPEVGVYFLQELVSLIRKWYAKGNKGDFISTIPLPVKIECAKLPGPDGLFTSPEEAVNPDALASKNRVLVIGNSNFERISAELKTTIEDTVVFIKYPFNILANDDEISEFVDSLKLTPVDVIVLGGQGNSLFQGMTTPKYKKQAPSGEPTGFTTSGAGKTKVFHAVNVASYDPEYFDNFGIFFERFIMRIKQTGAMSVLIPPFPRYPTACCTQAGHFFAGYDGNLFNAEVVRLGTYIARMSSLKETFVLTPEDFCHRDDWVSRGKMLQEDRVHLTDKGLKLVRDLVQKCVHFYRTLGVNLKPTLDSPVICDSLFSRWVEDYRESCGFDDLKASGNAKRPLSANRYQRPAKR